MYPISPHISHFFVVEITQNWHFKVTSHCWRSNEEDERVNGKVLEDTYMNNLTYCVAMG